MGNFFSDNPDIAFHLRRPRISRALAVREGDFDEANVYAHAPKDADDALDNAQRVLGIVGEIAADIVAPRAAAVDAVGSRFADGKVELAPGTVEALERLKKADLMGFTLPRRYGGLNMCKTVYTAATEIISRADASLMNLFGLQEIADTIYRYGTEEQRQRILPRFASGEVSGAMALTEPDAGSDLQKVMLKAVEAPDGTWRLSGVKRFITNGCADILLVMARSEEQTSGGRGISLFIYEREDHMRIRRIEHKLGIHGSPTCELQFDEAPAELLGKRKMGLVKYTMSLMNGARLAVAAQAVGIAEAAWREANAYAAQRVQFGRPIRHFTAVGEMLADMRVDIEATRALLYETARTVDLKEALEERIAASPELESQLRGELKRLERQAALLTPMAKAVAAEMANDVCDKAIQVHGGVGYTCEFPVERFYRDARITNIYEGTTQLQVVAAIGGVVGGVVTEVCNEIEAENDLEAVADLLEGARGLRTDLETALAHVKAKKDSACQEFHARRLVEMAADSLMACLLTVDAAAGGRKKDLALLFLAKARPRSAARREAIVTDDHSFLRLYPTVIDRLA